MSFSSDIKTELAELPVKMNCCKKALLFGLLYNSVHVEGTHMKVSFTGPKNIALLAEHLLGVNSQSSIKDVSSAGRKIYELSYNSKSFCSFEYKITHGESIPDAAKFRCEDCRSSFLRGVTIANATVNNPHKGYNMEYSLLAENKNRIDALSDFFTQGGITPKVREKEKTVSLYFKNNNIISDILSYIGAMKASFEFANSYIEKDIRNNENRATNCVARNISKSVEASRKQLEAIEKLIKHNKLESLSKELVETAYLRMDNDDVSLSELALLHEPPISKSGLNHRLKKICEEAKELE